MKETINKVKSQPSEWEKIIANEETDKQLISRIYKQLLQLNSRKSEEMEPKQTHPVVDVNGDGNTVQCCKEQYCTGTWNVRSMNQGKLEVVKQDGIELQELLVYF